MKSQITYGLRLLKRTGNIYRNSYLNSHRNAYQNPYRNSYWNFEGILTPTREFPLNIILTGEACFFSFRNFVSGADDIRILQEFHAKREPASPMDFFFH